VTHLHGDYALVYDDLPPVSALPGSPPGVYRMLTDQLQIRIDFPQSIVFGDHGDSGALVVSDGQAVGLYFASGSDSLGDPLRYGLASPAQTVEQALGITFSATA
jgi:hypothetical protein